MTFSACAFPQEALLKVTRHLSQSPSSMRSTAQDTRSSRAPRPT